MRPSTQLFKAGILFWVARSISNHIAIIHELSFTTKDCDTSIVSDPLMPWGYIAGELGPCAASHPSINDKGNVPLS